MPPTLLFHPMAPARPGRLGSLTKKEQAALSACKHAVKKKPLNLWLVGGPGEQEDLCVLRYLRASNFDEKKALAALSASAEWCAAVSLRQLREQQDDAHAALGWGPTDPLPPPCHQMCGTDRIGRPIVVVQLARLCSGAVTDAAALKSRQALLRWFVWIMERILQQSRTPLPSLRTAAWERGALPPQTGLADIKLRSGYIVEEIVVIADARACGGSSSSSGGSGDAPFLSHCGDAALALLSDATELARRHYPERLGLLAVLGGGGGAGSSGGAAQARALVRALGMEDALAAQRVVLLPDGSGGGGAWREALHAIADPSQLPADYGGALPALLPLDPPAADSSGGSSGSSAPAAANGADAAAATDGIGTDAKGSAAAAAAPVIRVPAAAAAAACAVLLWAMWWRPHVARAAVALALAHCLRLALLPAAAAARAAKGGGAAQGASRTEAGDGSSAPAAFGGSLAGAQVRVMEVRSCAGGSGGSGSGGGGGNRSFDAFCFAVSAAEGTANGSGNAAARAQWQVWRRAAEVVALRDEVASGALPPDRTWDLPPSQGVGRAAFAGAEADGPNSALARAFEAFGADALADRSLADCAAVRAFLGAAISSAAAAAAAAAAADAGERAAGKHDGGGGGGGAAERPVPLTSPSTPSQHAYSLSASSGTGAPWGTEGDSPAAALNTPPPGGSLPFLRPELQDLVMDRCDSAHTLKVPSAKEENTWLAKNRGKGGAPPPPPALPTPPVSPPPPSALQPTPEGDAALGASVHSMSSLGPAGSSNAQQQGPSQRSAASSPTKGGKRAALKRLMHGAKRRASTLRPGRSPDRKGGAQGGGGGAAGGAGGDAAGHSLCVLLHADVFEVPEDNDLHRLDHIASEPRSRAQARVKQLAAAKSDDPQFLFILNLQVPKVPGARGALSVVLYWGLPLEVMRVATAAGGGAWDPEYEQLLTPLHRELLQRYVDLPELLQRYVDLPCAHASQELLQRYVDLPCPHMSQGIGGDEADSGMLPDKDFRNSSLRLSAAAVPAQQQAAAAAAPAAALPAALRRALDDAQSAHVAKKLTVRYFRGPQYMETDLDIASAGTASTVAALCAQSAVTLDVGVHLEGAGRLLGCARLGATLLQRAELLPLPASAPPPSPIAPSGGGSGHRRFVASTTDALAGVFTDSGAAPVYHLRGLRYASDRRKEAASPAVGRLLAVDLFRVEGPLGRAVAPALWRPLAVDLFRLEGPLGRVCARSCSVDKKPVDNIARQGRCCERLAALAPTLPPDHILFMVNIQMPGTPPISLVAYWSVPVGPPASGAPDPDGARRKFAHLLARFVELPPLPEEGDEDEWGGLAEGGRLPPHDFRNQRFKLLPSILEGPWLVKKTVGNTPTLIGHKVTCRYFGGNTGGTQYFEVDIDIGSSQVAFKTASMAAGFAKGLTVDMGFCLQGEDESELPELLIGCLCISHLDMSLAAPLARPAGSSAAAAAAAVGADALRVHRQSAPRLSQRAVPPPQQQQLTQAHLDDWHAPTKMPPNTITIPPAAAAAAAGSGGGGASNGTVTVLESDALRGTFSDLRANHGFKLRGLTYMDDQIKQPAGEPVGRLLMCDLFRLPDDCGRLDNIASAGMCKKNIARISRPGEALFVLSYQVPGSPALSLVCVWGVPLASGDAKFDALFAKFRDLPSAAAAGEGDEGEGEGRVPGDDFRTQRFKLLPSIKDGPWIVRKVCGYMGAPDLWLGDIVVGSGATLLAQKLTCRHFQGTTAAGMPYSELDIDIGSSTVAYNTVSLAIGHAKALVVDMGICIQGDNESELPERLIGTVRLTNLDMSSCEPLFG
ncbi:hypothetical protein JKP88DRAFT_312182 [Tribonema minus]|uniref:CRAL-TRIO domain-containing protein n=1 Tax=Tribonema minus TaxID=303371 RepID=A0A835Z1B8_9STRA|nr:hypothetical protein JKP88DRAFT_312182 [Tribonema minus]